jgi:hypothetical protein
VSERGMLRRKVRTGFVAFVLDLGRLRGLGGGQTPQGPGPTSQVPDQQSLINAFMLIKFSTGISLSLTWLSLFLQFEKQYFWRNHQGQQQHLLFHFGRLSMFLLAKLIAHVSVASIQSSG